MQLTATSLARWCCHVFPLARLDRGGYPWSLVLSSNPMKWQFFVQWWKIVSVYAQTVATSFLAHGCLGPHIYDFRPQTKPSHNVFTCTRVLVVFRQKVDKLCVLGHGFLSLNPAYIQLEYSYSRQLIRVLLLVSKTGQRAGAGYKFRIKSNPNALAIDYLTDSFRRRRRSLHVSFEVCPFVMLVWLSFYLFLCTL